MFAIYKLHGESTYGKRPQTEMDELRIKLLRSIISHIVTSVESALSVQETVSVDKLIVPGSEQYEKVTPRVADLGKERLLNGVRDFIKSDVAAWQSLRSLDHADDRITNCLKQLRTVSVLLAIMSGLAAIAAAADKYAIHAWDIAWLHATALVGNMFLVAVSACSAIGIMRSVNQLDTLKRKHDDLS